VPPHKPTSKATELPHKFSAPAMLRSAAGHTKVKCTWDESNPQRKKDLVRKKFSPKELADMDLKAYLASSSEEEADADGAEALRALVGGESDAFGEDDEEDDESEEAPKGKKKKKGEEMGDMEATFSLKATRLEEELTERAKKGGQGVHTLESEEPKSAWQKYLDKRKEKRKEKKEKAREAKAKLRKGPEEESASKKKVKNTWVLGKEADSAMELDVLMDGGDSLSKGFNLRGPQRRAHDRGLLSQDGADDGFEVDVADPRISKVFSNADFEIDPTNPEFRKSEGMTEVLREKRQRKQKLGNGRKVPSQPSVRPVAPQAEMTKDPETTGKKLRAEKSKTGGLQLFASKQPEPAAENGGSASLQTGRKKRKKFLTMV